MNQTQANAILDQRKAGADMPEHVIIRALRETGDLPDLETLRAELALKWRPHGQFPLQAVWRGRS